MIQWIAYPSFVSAATIEDIQELVKYVSDDIISNTISSDRPKFNTKLFSSPIKYYNPEIALAYNTCLLSEKFESSKKKVLLISFLTNIQYSNDQFKLRISKVLRGIFLTQNLDLDIWKINFDVLLKLIKADECFASMFLMSVLYKLANDKDPEHHIQLLRGIPKFGVAKENIPIILNTLQALSQKNMTTLCIELYLNLWRIEPRTYSFLFKILSENVKGLEWEQHITKANTIKRICEYK